MKQAVLLQDLVDEVEPIPATRSRSGPHHIVVAGEFDSGKSSVVNLMLRRNLIPCHPGFLTRPHIRIRQGDREMIEAEDSYGNAYRVKSMEDLLRIENLSRCDIQLPMPELNGVEITELPSDLDRGVSIENLSLMGKADRIVWTTIASQAWRLSEKSIVEQLPPDCRERSVLVISRADKLRSRDDFEKIAQRLEREACDFFSEMIFVNASMGNVSALRKPEIWRRSGGAQLAQMLLTKRPDMFRNSQERSHG